ncbi:MAG: hypothetical protein ACE5FP_03250 [Gemmatimonadota bacterium]
MTLPTISRAESGDRWHLVRDIIVFQIKLALDGLRDLVFSPLSIGAGLIDLLTGGDRPGRYFYEVRALGGRTEGWINLFGAPNLPGRNELSARGPTIDSFVKQVEGLVVEQYERGGLTASAKEAIDRSLDSIARRGESQGTV